MRRQDFAKYVGGKSLVFFLDFSTSCYEHWKSVKQGKRTELKDCVAKGFLGSPLWTHGQARG